MTSDDDVRATLRGESGPISLRRTAARLRVGVARVRRVAVQEGIPFGSRGAVMFEDSVVMACRDAVADGVGLENDLGKLVAIMCGVTFEQVCEMARGGTITVCANRVPVTKLAGKKL